MWRKVFAGLLLLAVTASDKAGATQYAFQVSFTDKVHTPYTLSAPLDYLSPRSLARRATQSISVDSTDLPVDPQYIINALMLTGGKLHETSRWLNSCVLLLSDSTQIHALDGVSYVSGTKLVAYYSGMLHKPAPYGNSGSTAQSAQKTTAGGSTYYGNTWGQTSMISGQYLHDLGLTGSGKLIAVLDAGFDAVDTHPGFDSMRTSGRLADSYNFTLASSNVYGYGSHGTSAFSTIAGYVPGTYVGSAPLASYALYITEDNNSEQPIEAFNMLCAAERADSLGADIITTSLGYNIFDNFRQGDYVFATDLDGKSTVPARAANMATKKGILFVASAGNEGGNPWNNVLSPGDADSALTIGSVDNTGAVWATSGFGPNAVGQVKPDVCALGHVAAVFTTTGYASEDGTSFSTPQIAGWAACLWQGNPGATPFQLRQTIIKCASAYGTPTPHFGYGIPNFRCTEELLLSVKDTPAPFSPANWVIAAPLPFADELRLLISPAADDNVHYTIIDMSGKTVYAADKYAYKGINMPLSIDLSGLSSGTYLLKAIAPTQLQVLRIQKL